MPWRLFFFAWLYEAGSWFGFLAVVSWLEATGGPAWAGAYFVLYNGVQLPAAALLGPWLDRVQARALPLIPLLPLLALGLAWTTPSAGLGVLVGATFALGDYMVYSLVPALLPARVPRERLLRANAFWQMGSAVIFVLAPGIAGMVSGRLGYAAAFVPAAGFSLGALLLSLSLARVRVAGAAGVGLGGWGALKDAPAAIWAAVAVFVASLGTGLVNAALPVLTGGGEVYGYVLSAVGLGFFLGSVYTSRVGGWPLGLARAGLLAYAGGGVFFAFGRALWTWLMGGVFRGSGIALFTVGLNTALQARLPQALLGRVFSLGWALGNLGQMLGALAFSLAATEATRPFFLVSTLLSLLALWPLSKVMGAGPGPPPAS